MTEQELLNLFENPWFIVGVLVYSVWVIVWKGLALWRAGTKKDLSWFIILLIFNTLGILEIVYYFFVSKRNNK